MRGKYYYSLFVYIYNDYMPVYIYNKINTTIINNNYKICTTIIKCI